MQSNTNEPADGVVPFRTARARSRPAASAPPHGTAPVIPLRQGLAAHLVTRRIALRTLQESIRVLKAGEH